MRGRDKSFVNRCSRLNRHYRTTFRERWDFADMPTRSSASSVVTKKAANFGRVKF